VTKGHFITAENTAENSKLLTVVHRVNVLPLYRIGLQTCLLSYEMRRTRLRLILLSSASLSCLSYTICRSAYSAGPSLG